MNTKALRTRLARLGSEMIPRAVPRILCRYIGPGSERFPQPTQEELDEGWPVVTMRFVGAEDEQSTNLTSGKVPSR
jgi:hypothetical protein